MKRGKASKPILSLLVAMCILVSSGFYSALAAEEAPQNTLATESLSNLTPEIAEVAEVPEAKSTENQEQEFLKRLSDSKIYNGKTKDNELSKSTKDIDISKAVSISQLGAAAPLSLKSATIGTSRSANNAPVAGLNQIVLNPETMVNGQFTTDTLIFMAYVWNGIAYTYDIDGDELDLYIDGIPSEYMVPMISDDGGYSYQGVLFQFGAPGTYNMNFFAIDSYGTPSNIVSASFNVIVPPNFQQFEGELSSASDVQEFTVAANFAATPEFVVGMTRTGDGSIAVDILDSNGTSVGTLTAANDLHRQSGRSYSVLTKPSGAADVVNYTVRVKTSKYVSGDTKFRIMAGAKSLVPTMFSGEDNAVKLSRYYNYPQNQSRPGNVYNEGSLPYTEGHWYKIKGDSNMTITLMTRYSSQLRFKVYDASNFERVIFDSNDESLSRYTFRDSFNFTYNINKTKQALETGKDYYVVVYSLESGRPPQTTDTYALFCGEPYLESFTFNMTLSNINMIQGQQYTVSANFGGLTQHNAEKYINYLSVKYASSDDRKIIGDYYEVKFPNDYSWRNVSIYSGFEPPNDDSRKISVNGTTQIRFTAARTGTFHSNGVSVFILVEV